MTGAAVVVVSTAVVVAGAAVVAGALVLGAVVVAGATVAVLGAAVVELDTAAIRQNCQQHFDMNNKPLICSKC